MQLRDIPKIKLLKAKKNYCYCSSNINFLGFKFIGKSWHGGFLETGNKESTAGH